MIKEEIKDLRVTIVQTNQVWEDKLSNLEKYSKILDNVDETDLIILPEMFHTGFTMNLELSEDFDNSTGLNWLLHKSKSLDCAIYTSLIIKEDNKYYNRGVFVHSDGRIDNYDKMKSFPLAGEDKLFTPGNERKIIEYNGWKIQLNICYDLRFPEITRNKIVDGDPLYDLLIYVANWPDKRSEHWNTLLRARAIENQSYVIGVNRVGVDGNRITYLGDSKFIDALGNEDSLYNKNEFLI